jgi:ATP-dependent Clp protease ATP-binding subunit ClpB
MTSNLGSTHILDVTLSPDELRERVMVDVRGHFRPEFLNRIDELVIFDRLAQEQLRDIVDIQLSRLRERLAARDLTLEVTDKAMERLAELGYDPLYGARPLKRVIRKELEDQLARTMLAGELDSGQHVVVDVAEDGSMTFASHPAAAAEGAPA